MGNEALLASIIPKMHFSIQLNKILPERKEVAGGVGGVIRRPSTARPFMTALVMTYSLQLQGRETMLHRKGAIHRTSRSPAGDQGPVFL